MNTCSNATCSTTEILQNGLSKVMPLNGTKKVNVLTSDLAGISDPRCISQKNPKSSIMLGKI